VPKHFHRQAVPSTYAEEEAKQVLETRLKSFMGGQGLQKPRQETFLEYVTDTILEAMPQDVRMYLRLWRIGARGNDYHVSLSHREIDPRAFLQVALHWATIRLRLRYPANGFRPHTLPSSAKSHLDIGWRGRKVSRQVPRVASASQDHAEGGLEAESFIRGATSTKLARGKYVSRHDVSKSL
jgi:hypothetical protein